MFADLARVWALWRPRGQWLLIGIAVAILSALSAVALLALAGHGVALGVAAGGGALAILLLRPMMLLRPFLRWAERMASHEAAFRALADTRVWFFRRLAERMPAGLGLTAAGDARARMLADIEALDGLYLRAVLPAVAALAVVLAVAVILAGAPWLALAVAAPLGAALLLPFWLARDAAAAAERVARARGMVHRAALDPLLGLTETLSANAEGRAAARLREATEAMHGAEARLARRAALGGAAGFLLAQLALIGALAWALAAREGAGAAAPVGLAVLGLFMALAAAEVLGLAPRAGAALAQAGAAARRLFTLADTPPPVAEPAIPAAMPTGHTVRFEGVTFAWDPARGAVLQGLDLEWREGERIALLGPSGAGKSTILQLLLKLAAPQAGRITLGGVDLAALPAAAVRARIATLTQDARIFDASIAENLRIAAPEAPDAALWRVLAQVGLADLVRALPQGLDTPCGEGGARFSGGQARRIALARALLPAAPLLVLDEPTSGLDAETERAFLEVLEAATRGRSVLLITHRLTGVERPDRVLRLIGGRLLPATG
ncbi:MAG: thiol reductant ABC exporter subunit CydC [Rhodovarius sp.]|nr:thiol reductant ABC exporter subunit CydC [Rhodovarius sp.]MCX7933352.1 thiol reductant ABC exporter subunit CydC [Rhodovarius sp.]MDW8313802.1 thiol reductant ABC exporter subunit CydC [Rhodovarius sp.]